MFDLQTFFTQILGVFQNLFGGGVTILQQIFGHLTGQG